MGEKPKRGGKRSIGSFDGGEVGAEKELPRRRGRESRDEGVSWKDKLIALPKSKPDVVRNFEGDPTVPPVEKQPVTKIEEEMAWLEDEVTKLLQQGTIEDLPEMEALAAKLEEEAADPFTSDPEKIEAHEMPKVTEWRHAYQKRADGKEGTELVVGGMLDNGYQLIARQKYDANGDRGGYYFYVHKPADGEALLPEEEAAFAQQAREKVDEVEKTITIERSSPPKDDEVEPSPVDPSEATQWEIVHREGPRGGLILDGRLEDGTFLHARQDYQLDNTRGQLYLTHTAEKIAGRIDRDKIIPISAKEEAAFRVLLEDKIVQGEEMLKTGWDQMEPADDGKAATIEADPKPVLTVVDAQVSHRKGKFGGLILNVNLSDGTMLHVRQTYEADNSHGPLYITRTTQKIGDIIDKSKTIRISPEEEETFRALIKDQLAAGEELLKNDQLDVTGAVDLTKQDDERKVEVIPSVKEWRFHVDGGTLMVEATMSDGTVLAGRQSYEPSGDRSPLVITHRQSAADGGAELTLDEDSEAYKKFFFWATTKVGEVEDLMKSGQFEHPFGVLVPPTRESEPGVEADSEAESPLEKGPASAWPSPSAATTLAAPSLTSAVPETVDWFTGGPGDESLSRVPTRTETSFADIEGAPFEPSVPASEARIEPPPADIPSAPTPPRSVSRRVGLVDVSDRIRTQARDQAERELAGERRQPGVRGFLRHMWRHGVAVGYYRRQMEEAARVQILQNENIYGGGRGDRSAHEQTMADVVERFTLGDPRLIHELAGERVLGQTEQERAAQGQIQTGVNELIRAYARGELNNDSFREERNRLLSRIPGLAREAVDSGAMFADNLLRIAQEVRQNVEHGIGLAALDEEFEVVIGRARLGQRTEEQRSMLARAIDRMRETGVSRYLPETVLASAISISSGLASAGSFGAQMGARSVAFMAGGLGLSAVVGGGFAGGKEYRRVAEERQHHARERAVGRQFNERESPRCQEMEQYIHAARDARGLTGELSDIANQVEGGALLTAEQFTAAVQQLAEATARTHISDGRHVDLLSFSRVEAVESERTALDLARYRAQDALRSMAGREAGLLPTGATFDQYLETTVQCNLRELGEGMSQTDQAFRGMQLRRAGRAALRGAAIGLVVGAAAQEGAAFLRDSQAGLVEGWLRPDHQGTPSTTPLEYLHRWYNGTLDMPNMPNWEEHILGGHHYQLPEGADFVINPDKTVALVQHGARVVDHLPLNPDQSLSAEALQRLADHGLGVDTHHELLTSTTTTQASADDYVQRHPELFKRIMRGLWNDNNTPKPEFDLNEEKFDIFQDKLGRIVLSAKRMIPEGSFHGKHMADAVALAKEGKLKVLLSLTRGTQRFVREFVMNDKLEVVLDPHTMTDVDKLMFSGSGSSLHFNGGFAEIAETLGYNSDGIEQVGLLATVPGNGVPSVVDSIVGSSSFEVTSIHSLAPTMEGPWFIPLPQSREPLGETWPGWGEGYGYSRMTVSELAEFRDHCSPRLSNPDAVLDQYRETTDYFARLDHERRQETEDLAEHLPPMERECRLAVCIPVAGHQESRNIYETLSAYTNQHDNDGSVLNPKSFELLLFVNNPKDTSAVATLAEIDRFQHDHPEMMVRAVHKEFDRPDIAIGNMRKYATDIALLRHQQLGSDMPDLIIVSNDADCRGLSPQYLATLRDRLQGDDEHTPDIMLGKFDWDPASYADSPLYHVGTRMAQFLDSAIRHHPNLRRRNIPSSGANSAFKGSMYAAINGYRSESRKFEDVEIGNMIKVARENSKRTPIVLGGDSTMLYTHPRRGISAAERGIAPALQWSGEFGPDDKIRDTVWIPSGRSAEEMSRLLDDPAEQEKLQKGVELFLEQTFGVYQVDVTSWEARKTMRFLGVRYEIKNNRIHITDMSRLIEQLKNYQRTWEATKAHKVTHVATDHLTPPRPSPRRTRTST